MITNDVTRWCLETGRTVRPMITITFQIISSGSKTIGIWMTDAVGCCLASHGRPARPIITIVIRIIPARDQTIAIMNDGLLFSSRSRHRPATAAKGRQWFGIKSKGDNRWRGGPGLKTGGRPFIWPTLPVCPVHHLKGQVFPGRRRRVPPPRHQPSRRAPRAGEVIGCCLAAIVHSITARLLFQLDNSC